ncbi:Trm112 family protein [Nocardioides zeae]|uniref:UPF0434 protein RDV89_17680 n=1 Tax=Nocardioides imazamoxiresistens TaxID=3231893 RepID=A0ABU3Q0C9_9ACTN|nr:Trm112 family protein [Nocardioides zeae]MDT9594924.1 Trm112 family protein [Nocardioides zeae]
MSDETTIDRTLLSIVACPACRSTLDLRTGSGPTGTELACTGCDLVYPVREGIPVLLVDEARRAG